MQKILLVEDQKDFQLIVQNCLSDRFVIRVAANLSEAKQKVMMEEFDLILLDAMLPDGSGFDLARRLKADHFLRHIPIVFMTSRTELKDRNEGYAIGADDYIAKPFKPREFTARISYYLEMFGSRG